MCLLVFAGKTFDYSLKLLAVGGNQFGTGVFSGQGHLVRLPVARRTQAQPSSFEGVVVGTGEGTQGCSRGLIIRGDGDGYEDDGGGGGEGIVDGYEAVVEELGVDGRYAVEQRVVRVGLDNRSQTTRGPIRMRGVHDHGRKSETNPRSALGDFLYAPYGSARASRYGMQNDRITNA